MGGLQGRKHVAAGVNEGFHAGLLAIWPRSRPAGRRDGRWRRQPASFARPSAASCSYTLSEEHRQARLAPEALNAATSASRLVEAVIAHRLDAAGLVEILGEGGARGEVGRRAEIGEEHFRPRAGFGEDASERSRSASNGSARRMRGSGSMEAGAGLLSAAATRGTSSTARGLLVQIRIFAGAGERVLAARGDWLARCRARRRHCAGSAPCSSAARRRPLPRSPETAPRRRRRAWRSDPRCRRSRRPGRRPLAKFDSSSRRAGCCARRGARKRSGRPSAAVCGSTVMLSAPPRPAAETAMVVRSMFT